MAGSAADIKQECRVLGAGPGRAWFVNSLLYSVTQTFTWVKAGAASLSGAGCRFAVWTRLSHRGPSGRRSGWREAVCRGSFGVRLTRVGECLTGMNF